MNANKPFSRLMAMVLSVALMLTGTPVSAAEGDTALGDSGISLGASGHITAFAELDDDLRWQRDYTPKLPETLEATLNGGPAQIPVTWEAEGYSAAAYNAPGLYIFYAKPGEGFTVADGVTPPKITYMQLSMMRMAGVGSDTNPLQITRADQLAEIAGLVNEGLLEEIVFGGDAIVYLKLMNDITLTGEWTPIGHDSSNKFKGRFDGNNKTISGLKITVGTYDATGLFGFVEGGPVKNLKLAGVDISGNENVGGVAGYVYGNVENCSVTGKVGGSARVGGVAGHVAPGGSVTDCYSKAAVSGSVYSIGGVVGLVSGGSVERCYSTGAVSSSGHSIGGVAGGINSGGSVANCYSTGAVSGVSVGGLGGIQVGGVAGTVEGGSVKNCYSTGAVSGNYSIGGVAGLVCDGGSVTDCAALNPSVENTDSTDLYAGRVTGYSNPNYNFTFTLDNNVAFDGMTITEGGNDKTINGTDTATGIDGADLAAVAVTGDIGGRFPSEYWAINYDLPLLWELDGQDQLMPAHLINAYTLYFDGSGTIGEPYLIETEAQLRSLADLVNAGITPYANPDKFYKLTADITLTGEWTPIGTSFGMTFSPFRGSFDGNDHTIRGLYINKPGDSCQGLFGSVVALSAIQIKNVRLVDCDITGYQFVGGIAGSIVGYSSGEAQVLNCSVSGKVAGNVSVGGIAGAAGNVDIEKSFTACTVTADLSAGGIAGNLDASNVTDCYTTGDVASSGDAGGIAGILDSGTNITRCYSTGSIYGGTLAGGIAGDITGTGTITDCAALNPSVACGGGTGAGRVLGYNGSSNNLDRNVAFRGMTGTSTWSNTGENDLDGADKTADDLRTGGFPVGLTQSPWTYASGKLPGLNGKTVEMPGHIGGGYFAGGDGSEENPFQIKTAEQLASLAALVNADNSSNPVWADKYYKLMNDLTLTGQWTPIGHTDDSTAFKGHFDGGNHTIFGLKVSASTNAGLFGIVVGGSVKNLGLVDVDIVGGSGNSAGGVAGYVLGGSVENCYVTGSVSCGNSAGGVAGGVYSNGSVKNCCSTGAVNGNFAGGVAGVVSGGSVENCYSTGAVTGGIYAGGVAGTVQPGSVKDCAALNSSVKIESTGPGTGVGRVAGYKHDTDTTLSGNYAFISMAGGNWNNIGAENLDGADMAKIQAVTPSFWTGTMGWDTSVWTLAQGKLPTLFGEDGEPGLSLTGLPTGDLSITPQTATANPGGSVAFTVTRMESWTHQQIDWTTTAGTIVSTANGNATLTVPANAAAGSVITVTAENENSGKSVSATVTVITVPGAPENLTAIPGDGQVTLSWSAPASDGGSPITNYHIYEYVQDKWVDRGLDTSVTFTGLTNGQEYSFWVWAVNAVGNGLTTAVTATPNGSAATVPVTGVTLDLSTLTLVAQGDTRTLTATVLPANATNKAVTWQSSDSGVATVDASGTVAGISEGKATITVTTQDGNKTASCAVTVLPVNTVPVYVTGVSVSPASVSMSPGNTRRLTATVTPADATIRDISWSSSDLTVATVDGSGKVTAVALGSATITATTVDGGFTATCAVTVTSGTGGYTPGGSDSGSGSGSSGTDYTTTTTSSTPSDVGQSQATDAAAKAAAAAKASGGNIATVNMRNVGNITLAALQTMAKAAGMPVKFQADSMSADGKAVEVRITLDPGKSTKGLNLSASTSNAGAKASEAIFEKWFKNNVSVVSFAQQGDFGQPVDIAAKVDLTGMDTSNLYFYAYDKKTNTYRRIEKPAYWIDKNGYLHFTTELAGDIIICEGPLERK